MRPVCADGIFNAGPTDAAAAAAAAAVAMTPHHCAGHARSAIIARISL